MEEFEESGEVEYITIRGEEYRLYEVDVSPGRTVQFREMSVDEFEACMEQAQGDMGWQLSMMGIRRCLVSDRGEQVSYEDVMGKLLGRRFRLPELIVLQAAWNHVHMPDEEYLERVRGIRAE